MNLPLKLNLVGGRGACLPQTGNQLDSQQRAQHNVAAQREPHSVKCTRLLDAAHMPWWPLQ